MLCFIYSRPFNRLIQGPPLFTSAFDFERLMHELLGLIQGTRYETRQVGHGFCLKFSLEIFKRRFPSVLSQSERQNLEEAIKEGSTPPYRPPPLPPHLTFYSSFFISSFPLILFVEKQLLKGGPLEVLEQELLGSSAPTAIDDVLKSIQIILSNRPDSRKLSGRKPRVFRVMRHGRRRYFSKLYRRASSPCLPSTSDFSFF